MGNEVEAGAQRVRNHLQRPDHPDRQLTNAKVGSTVNQTAPPSPNICWMKNWVLGESWERWK